jgi:hypothetical protein
VILGGEYVNEPSASIKFGDFLGQLNAYKIA